MSTTITNSSTVTVKSTSINHIVTTGGERLDLMTGPWGGRRPRKGEVLGVYTSPAGIRYAARPR